MSFNLLHESWIPVVMRDGTRRVIAAWQMADPDIVALDWPRMDLNIACLELLIGLVYLADPPEDDRLMRLSGRPLGRCSTSPFCPA